MAHSNNSIVTGKFSGTPGKELVFREWEGKTVEKQLEETGIDPWDFQFSISGEHPED